MKPFIKWAGGKRWLVDDQSFTVPAFTGKYIEPFLGGGAVFFHLAPAQALLSDINSNLINVYLAIRDDWRLVQAELQRLQTLHSSSFYYEERRRIRRSPHTRAAQFLYLNRTCWNGLYRENLSGKFNVPIGTKTQVILPDDDFEVASSILKNAKIMSCDFEETLDAACEGDFVFIDPPYTTAHNTNGFVKYNQKIFSWMDQVRLQCAIAEAYGRGATVLMTNADHQTIHELYSSMGTPQLVSRASVISGKPEGRGRTTEALFLFKH